MLYYALAINLSMIFFPYNVIVQPILISIVLNAYYYFLVFISKKPVASSNKDNTGTIVTFLNSLSFSIWLIFVTLLMIIKVKHEPWMSDKSRQCGPIKTLDTFQKVIEDMLTNGGFVLDYGRAIVFSWPVTICALILIFVHFQFNFNEYLIRKRYVDDQIGDYLNQEQEVFRQIVGKQKKIDILQKQVEAKNKMNQKIKSIFQEEN